MFVFTHVPVRFRFLNLHWAEFRLNASNIFSSPSWPMLLQERFKSTKLPDHLNQTVNLSADVKNMDKIYFKITLFAIESGKYELSASLKFELQRLSFSSLLVLNIENRLRQLSSGLLYVMMSKTFSFSASLHILGKILINIEIVKM